MNPELLTRKLIDIPSVTGEEAGVAVAIEELCTRFGWEFQREYVGEQRWNLYINWRAHAKVVYCSHLDTVPPHSFSSADAEFIHGRGACDTKGIIAAMLCAGEKLSHMGSKPSFLFVVGEETGSEGAKCAACSGRTAEFIIVGEPTENMLALGHKGALSYTLRTRGISAHSSLPEKGRSAIEMLLPILADVRDVDWPGHPVLGATTTSITCIGGGSAINVIPDTAWAKVFHRITCPLDEARALVTRAVGARAELEFHSTTNPQELVVVDGFPTTVVSFGTDVPYLRSMGRPLLFGPGSIEDAHTATEKISIRQLHDAVERYVELHAILTSQQG